MYQDYAKSAFVAFSRTVDSLFFCRLYSKSQKCRVVEKYLKVACSNDKVVVDALISLPSSKCLQMSEFSTARAKRDVVQQFHSLEKDN